MNILTDSQISRSLWNELLKNNEFASPFQSFKFYSFFNSMLDLSANAFACEDNSELIALCVVTYQKEKGIKGFFSRRAIIYGGPLIKHRNFKALSILLQYIKSYYKKRAIYIEIRNFFNYSDFNDTFKSIEWQYIPYLNFQLNLNNISKDQILSKFKYNRRREIKQSIKNGATYALCNSEDELIKIYEILEELYRKKVKLPLPPLHYFISLYKYNIIKVFIVKHENKVIGGAFCPILPQRNIYTYYYCGIRDYHKKIFPTHLAVLATIEYAIDNNIRILDFMGAGKPNEEYGVRKYKSEFGGNLVEDGRYIKILHPLLFRIGKLGLKILSKI